jgi:invasion protein IalB
MLETAPNHNPKELPKMAKTTRSALALMATLAAMPLAAQTTTTEAPATGADSSAATDLSLGQQVNTGGVGETYTAASFEDWQQRCVRTESGADPCQLYKLLKDEQGNSVAEFTVFGLPAGSEGPAVAGATFIAPLETLLTSGMRLQIDEGQSKVYPFTFCAELGCVVRLGFTAEEVQAMKKGANAVISIVPFVAPDQNVTLTVSLKGFTAGLEAVDTANAAADAAAAAAAPAAAPAEAAPAEAAPATNP